MRRWYWIEPVDELRHMQYRMDKLLKEMFDPSYTGRALLRGDTEKQLTKTTEPFVDVYEKDDKLVIKADIPGVDKKDIKIDVKGDLLDITAERKDETEEKDDGYIRKERFYSKYRRSITLPTEIDPEKTEANFKDGVLELSMPKLEGVGEVKRIEVN